MLRRGGAWGEALADALLGQGILEAGAGGGGGWGGDGCRGEAWGGEAWGGMGAARLVACSPHQGCGCSPLKAATLIKAGVLLRLRLEPAALKGRQGCDLAGYRLAGYRLAGYLRPP